MKYGMKVNGLFNPRVYRCRCTATPSLFAKFDTETQSTCHKKNETNLKITYI